MISIFNKLEAYSKLGLANILRVVWYQVRLKSGNLRNKLPVGEPLSGDFFDTSVLSASSHANRRHSNQILDDVVLFGWKALALDKIPDWSQSVLTGKRVKDNSKHWTEYSDFSLDIGDIKGVWEPSRFTWSIALASNFQSDADISHIQKLNQWLVDWSEHNPVNRGVNWKCAQETSFRIIHLAATSLLLKQTVPTPTMCRFVAEHLVRIAPTLGYAKAQDNNHGTTEAAALYIGASWLLKGQPDNRQAMKWFKRGERYLYERVNRLVMPDGTFSQYSVTYHRLMLDTMSLVVLWNRYLALPALSPGYIERMTNAVDWLFTFTDSKSGDAPNIGANDGAHILNFFACPFRDFRYSVELGRQLFCGSTAYGGEIQRRVSSLFDLSSQSGSITKTKHKTFSSGGFAHLSSIESWGVLHFPVFSFRPSQADLLHFDLWYDGENILRDGGSFSYNTEPEWLDYFSGTASHNTVQIDNRQQMPKVSRFLFGKWPKAYNVKARSTDDGCEFVSKYSDWLGASHERRIEFLSKSVIIVDSIKGVNEKATLRWRLKDGEWNVSSNKVTDGIISIDVKASEDISRFNLVKGYESRYYGKKNQIPVLEIDVEQDAQIMTTINWT